MTDFKKDTRTAQEQAEAIWPSLDKRHHTAISRQLREVRRASYADCITEQVTPRDEFIAELVEALDKLKKAICVLHPKIAIDITKQLDVYMAVQESLPLLTKARERGYDHE